MKNKTGLRIKDPEPTARTPSRIAFGLYKRLSIMADKHLPKPTKTVFMEFIMNLGMDYYDQNRMLEKEYKYEGADATGYKMPFFFKQKTLDRLEALSDAHRPEVQKRYFLEYILHLGIEHYYKEYTIYGFKRD
jgi:hypothetical protein